MSHVASFEQTVGAEKAPAGHPPGLYVLFGAEMWERFSYYGMRALLVLYLTKHLHFNRGEALGVYAIYTSLVYLTPLLGGVMADLYLGQRKAILIGGLLMALGHFAMASETLLYYALGLLVLGNGFFKPNISTMVGQLYGQGDPRRDSAYTIFYMGINLGAFFSPLVCGTLGEKVGWHYGFGAAGVGMLLGLMVFTVLQWTLGTGGYPPGSESESEHRLRPIDWVHVAVLTAIGVGLVYLAIGPANAVARGAAEGFTRVFGAAEKADPNSFKIIHPDRFGKVVLFFYWVGLALVMALATSIVTRLGGSTRPRRIDSEILDPSTIEKEDPVPIQLQRVAVIFIVAIFSIVFWMGFEQAGGTLTLFADQKTDRHLMGREFPASWFQSVNPLLIFILAPLFMVLWKALDRTRYSLTSTAKMGIGLLLLGAGFVIMGRAETVANRSGMAGPEWLGGVYLLFTLGELCLSPIGLSLVNKLAPRKVASLMMAVWFTCTFIANYLAGTLESILEASKMNIWTFLVFTSVVPGLILLALTPLLKKMGHGRI